MVDDPWGRRVIGPAHRSIKVQWMARQGGEEARLDTVIDNKGTPLRQDIAMNCPNNLLSHFVVLDYMQILLESSTTNRSDDKSDSPPL